MKIKGTITFEADIIPKDSNNNTRTINLGEASITLSKGDSNLANLNAIAYLIWQDIQGSAFQFPNHIIYSPEVDDLRELINSKGIEGYKEDNNPFEQ